MRSFLEDLSSAFRHLRNRPGFAAMCIVTLALATGANIAIFSLVYAVLLRPLPYPEPDRLYTIWEDATQYGFPLNSPAPANFMDWKRQSKSFSNMAAFSTDTFTLTGSGEPAVLQEASVSADIFSLLGSTKAELGRVLTGADDTAGAERVCVLSHAFWQSRFSGDRTIVGRTILLDGNPVIVAGVMPADFIFPTGEIDVIVPFAWKAETQNDRDDHYLYVMGRLRDGMNEGGADQEMKLIARRLETAYPQTNKNLGARIVSLRSYLTGDFKTALLALLCASVLVLLIACVNLAGLQFSHAIDRIKEMTVRAALGATSFRLARMLLCENLILALAGGAAGLMASVWIARGLSGLLPVEVLSVTPIGMHLAVLLFAAIVSLVSGLLSGIVPAWQLYRHSLAQGMKEGGGKLMGGRNRIRAAFVVGEIALCVCLVIAAGLMIRSLDRLLSVPLGFNPAGALTARTTLSPKPYKDYDTRMRFYSQVLQNVRSMKGVSAAGYTSHLPLSWSGDNNTFVVEGLPEPPPGQENIVSVRVVSPDYFRALGATMIEGRDFADTDRLETPPVVIVSESLARKYWPVGQAVNKRIQRGKPVTPDGWMTVVGVVPDLLQSSLEIAPKPEIYLPYTQRKAFYFSPQDLVIRVQGDPLTYTASIRRIVWDVDKYQPVSNMMPLGDIVRKSSSERVVHSILFTAFGVVALLLSALGIYGLLSHMVIRRTPEIGIRVVLGARPTQLIRMVVVPAMGMTLLGIVVGGVVSLALSRLMQGLLFEVSPTDAMTFAAVPFLLMSTAFIACWIPARRATRIDPNRALRCE